MAYYRTEEGKIKKQLQNSKRSKAASTPEEEGQGVAGVSGDGSGFDAGMLLYLAMVTSLIEGRAVSREEVLEMLQRAVRQHSMSRLRRVDYLVWHLNKPPP